MAQAYEIRWLFFLSAPSTAKSSLNESLIGANEALSRIANSMKAFARAGIYILAQQGNHTQVPENDQQLPAASRGNSRSEQEVHS